MSYRFGATLNKWYCIHMFPGKSVLIIIKLVMAPHFESLNRSSVMFIVVTPESPPALNLGVVSTLTYAPMKFNAFPKSEFALLSHPFNPPVPEYPYDPLVSKIAFPLYGRM